MKRSTVGTCSVVSMVQCRCREFEVPRLGGTEDFSLCQINVSDPRMFTLSFFVSNTAEIVSDLRFVWATLKRSGAQIFNPRRLQTTR